MSFKDALEANDYRPHSVPCSVKVWRDKQTPTNQREFDEALANPDISTASIHRTMKGMGYGLPTGNVQRHRRKDCRCDVQ